MTEPSASGHTKAPDPMVLVVDDDSSMRDAVINLLRSVGLSVIGFTSAHELLQSDMAALANCLIVDVRLPGISGLDLQAELSKADVCAPIILITGHGDVPMSVRAMKAGAVDFLTKPFRDQDLLDAVAAAIASDSKRRHSENMAATLRGLFRSLTPREQQIMSFVTAGLMNKNIAIETGLSEITVKIYRGQVMKKMGARSLADLVRMAESLRIHRIDP